MTSPVRAVDRAPHVEPKDRGDWRRWLEANHATAAGVWLVSRRRSSDRGDLDYQASVEEALSFGWIDGQAAGVDEHRSKQYFAPRRPRSPWSRPNKERVQRMLSAGRVAPSGLAAVERADRPRRGPRPLPAGPRQVGCAAALGTPGVPGADRAREARRDAREARRGGGRSRPARRRRTSARPRGPEAPVRRARRSDQGQAAEFRIVKS